MDGDDLGESEPSEPPTLAEIFTQAFPYYLAMGMTYDEFWHGAPSLVRAYRKAQDMKRHEKNYELWMQGRYIFEALRCAPLLVGFPEKGYKVPSGAGYPEQPYPLTEQEAQVLTLRFGLEGGLPCTPQEVGARLMLTPEQVVQTEAAALQKLRNTKED